MKLNNSIKYFNDSITNSKLEGKTNSNKSLSLSDKLQSIKEIKIRKYIESLNTLKSKNIHSSFIDTNYQFLSNEYKIPKNLYLFLEYSFLSLFYLISKPIIEITPDKITLVLFCYKLNKDIIYNDNNKLLNKNKGINQSTKETVNLIENIDRIKLRILSLILRKLFKKTVELEIIRLYYPFYNSNIFVNLLSKTLNKIKINRILYKFFDKANIFNPNKLIGRKISNIPSFVSGIKIRIAGRLMTQRIVPRKTVKTISKGNLSRNKTIYLEKCRFTNKNKRGAFNVTVIIGHIKI